MFLFLFVLDESNFENTPTNEMEEEESDGKYSVKIII